MKKAVVSLTILLSLSGALPAQKNNSQQAVRTRTGQALLEYNETPVEPEIKNMSVSVGANTPFLSIQYLHQGFGDNFYASWIGQMFCYRYKKLFQAGIGLGQALEKGPQWTRILSKEQQKTNISFLYNIGIYL
jgi:hypothetical protein